MFACRKRVPMLNHMYTLDVAYKTAAIIAIALTFSITSNGADRALGHTFVSLRNVKACIHYRFAFSRAPQHVKQWFPLVVYFCAVLFHGRVYAFVFPRLVCWPWSKQRTVKCLGTGMASQIFCRGDCCRNSDLSKRFNRLS